MWDDKVVEWDGTSSNVHSETLRSSESTDVTLAIEHS
jgi:hypothetical protein